MDQIGMIVTTYLFLKLVILEPEFHEPKTSLCTDGVYAKYQKQVEASCNVFLAQGEFSNTGSEYIETMLCPVRA